MVIQSTSITCQHQTTGLASAPTSLFGPTKIPNFVTKCEWSALCSGENSVVPTGQKNEWTFDQSTFNTKQEKCLILPHIKLPFTCGPACSVSHYNVWSPPPQTLFLKVWYHILLSSSFTYCQRFVTPGSEMIFLLSSYPTSLALKITDSLMVQKKKGRGVDPHKSCSVTRQYVLIHSLKAKESNFEEAEWKSKVNLLITWCTQICDICNVYLYSALSPISFTACCVAVQAFSAHLERKFSFVNKATDAPRP
jgi:hypothetical protein